MYVVSEFEMATERGIIFVLKKPRKCFLWEHMLLNLRPFFSIPMTSNSVLGLSTVPVLLSKNM